MKYRSLFLLSLAALFMLSSGCGQKLPKGMPKLYKTQLTITQDGKPLEGANVVVTSANFASAPWSSGGITDASGSVILKTEGQYDGVPIGSYVVTVTKIEGPPGLELPKNSKTDADFREYDRILKQIEDNSVEVVDKQFMNMKTTPLKLEVKGKTNETFDVSPAVKNKIERGPSA